MADRDVAVIDAATATRLLGQYRVLLLRARTKYRWLDESELRAVWEDAVCEGYQSYKPGEASEATWISRVFRWRLQRLVKQSRQVLLSEPLGTDPQVLNGINPEQAFWEAAAMEELLRLPPRQQIIVLAHLNGYTYAEVADQVGIKKSRAHEEAAQAIKLIRERLVLGGSKDRP